MKPQAEEDTGIFRGPPILYLAAFVAGGATHSAFPIHFLLADWLRLAIGLPTIVLAGAFWISAILALRRAGTAVNPGKPTTALVAQGPFRFSRNPLYLSLALIYLGATISLDMLWPLVFLPGVLAAIGLVVRQEERYLERKFGQVYLDYKAKVRRWL